MPYDENDNTKLTAKLEEALKVKHTTARVYASSIRQLATLLKIKFTGADVSWLTKRKVVNHLNNVVNLTRKKNLASGAVAGLKLLGNQKIISDYREILMRADKDHKSFLMSGKRKKRFKNADKQWKMIRQLWKKASLIVNAKRLWSQGESIAAKDYKILMQLVYLKFLSDMPVRRLEYSDTKFATEPDKMSNLIITRAKGTWRWRLNNYKTHKNFGTQEYKLTPGLKKILQKIRPIAKAKDNDGYIFLNTRWKPMSRNAFSLFVSQTMKTFSGKRWTQNTIRAIKVSSVWKDSIKTIEALKVSEEMAHDPRTALVYYRDNAPAAPDTETDTESESDK